MERAFSRRTWLLEWLVSWSFALETLETHVCEDVRSHLREPLGGLRVIKNPVTCIGKAARILPAFFLRMFGYTQSMLAMAMALGPTYRTHISRIENGRVAPSAGFILRAAVALGVVRILVCARTQEPMQFRDPNKPVE